MAFYDTHIMIYVSKLAITLKHVSSYPANIVRDEYVIITSKRRLDVIITYLLRTLFAG